MAPSVKATEVTAGLVECNDSLLPGIWLNVTCALTACTPGSALGPTLGKEYRKTSRFMCEQRKCITRCSYMQRLIFSPKQSNSVEQSQLKEHASAELVAPAQNAASHPSAHYVIHKAGR